MLFLIGLNSCCRCKKFNLTAEEKEWINIYDSGQVILFKSNLSHFDTFEVVEKRNFYTNSNCNCLEIGNTQSQTLDVTLRPKTCHDSFYCDVYIGIVKDTHQQKTQPTIRVFELAVNSENFESDFHTLPVILSTNRRIYDALCYQNQSQIKYGNNYLKKFYWDRKEGLIRYEANNGELFELWRK